MSKPRQIALIDGLRCVAGQLDLVAGQVGISATLAERLTESTVERQAARAGSGPCPVCGHHTEHLFCSPQCAQVFKQQEQEAATKARFDVACLHCGKRPVPTGGMFCSARCKAKFVSGRNRYARELAQLKEPEGSQDLLD